MFLTFVIALGHSLGIRFQEHDIKITGTTSVATVTFEKAKLDYLSVFIFSNATDGAGIVYENQRIIAAQIKGVMIKRTGTAYVNATASTFDITIASPKTNTVYKVCAYLGSLKGSIPNGTADDAIVIGKTATDVTDKTQYPVQCGNYHTFKPLKPDSVNAAGFKLDRNFGNQLATNTLGTDAAVANIYKISLYGSIGGSAAIADSINSAIAVQVTTTTNGTGVKTFGFYGATWIGKLQAAKIFDLMVSDADGKPLDFYAPKGTFAGVVVDDTSTCTNNLKVISYGQLSDGMADNYYYTHWSRLMTSPDKICDINFDNKTTNLCLNWIAPVATKADATHVKQVPKTELKGEATKCSVVAAPSKAGDIGKAGGYLLALMSVVTILAI